MTVDENGKALAGIEVQIDQQSLPPKREWEPFKAHSDAKGMLAFPNLRYGILRLAIHADGYLFDPALDNYLMSGLQFGQSYRPEEKGLGLTPERPYVWRLWKRRGPPQTLVRELIVVQCPQDGTPMSVDLTMEHPWGGIPIWAKTRPADMPVDLKVSITRSPDDKFMITKPWSYSIEAPTGGLVEATDTMMYLAPEGGYRPKIDATVQQGRLVHKRYFLKSRDGKMYAAIKLEVSPLSGMAPEATGPEGLKNYNPPGEVQVNCTLNPTGSRSFEPDAKRTYKCFQEYQKAEGQGLRDWMIDQ